MLTVKGKRITLTKGDTAVIDVPLFDANGNPYEAQEGDEMRFAMKKLYTDALPILTKEIDMDDYVLTILPEDTQSLDAPCSYVFDIQVSLASGTIDTVIPNGTLYLTEEVD